MVKILIAADSVGVTYKTIYNWLEDGSLKLAHPGFVYMSDVRRVWIQKQNIKSETSRTVSSMFTRDDRGRFKLLSGGMKNRTYKVID